ncbi:hypothetical protein KJ636_05165 [Patescibacteria group bacterium]|nr:hypothetical protein [Patescibacteria group bacterium]
MAIEINPKPANKNPFLNKSLFYLSIILLLFIVFSYFILDRFQKSDSEKIRQLEAKISSEKTQEWLSLEEELKTKKKKIDDFSVLIGEHKLPSKFLAFSEGTFLETKSFGNLIHPKVQILSFSLDVKNSKVQISGLTENFITLEQQYLIFQSEPLLKEVNLSNISLGKEGKINFSFDLSFDPSVLK